VVVEKLGYNKSMDELTSIIDREEDHDDHRIDHDTWRTKSLVKSDSFNSDFFQVVEAEDKAIRELRVTAALENIQV
jgi:hypothetical protein